MRIDPVENTEEYRVILPELEAKIDAALEGVKRSHGFCHKYWHVKAEILQRDYGIEWQSPAMLNRRVKFD